MIDSKIAEFVKLKSTATSLKKRGQLERALKTISKVIEGLEALAETPDLDAEDAKRVRAETSDAYGMKGGILRRLERPKEALDEYEQGLELEQQDRDDTYNLSNVISLSIELKKASPSEPDMKKKLRTAIAHLEEKTSGERADEWWAWSDLGQFHLLLEQTDEAWSCYERAKNDAGVRPADVKRHVEILRALAQATLERDASIAEALTNGADALTEWIGVTGVRLG